MQVNRTIQGCPALDDVDHALGRPYRPFNAYRDHYATCCPKQKAEMRASEWWSEGVTRGDMTFFHVTDAGKTALVMELQDVTKYGRLFEVYRVDAHGSRLVMAKNHSAAKYAAYIEADIDWSFMEFCDGLRVRLAA